jgi:outer membrane lipoprotein carrier protein
MKVRIIVAAVLAGFAQVSLAAGIDLIRSFVNEVRAAKTEFVQTVVDNSGKPVAQSMGTFLFERPGKFRWTYTKPYEQLIVGDGRKVWVYDKDLNQVTVKALGDALGSSPAALLAGSNDLDRAYTFAQLPKKDGLEWVEAVPTDPDSQFESGIDAALRPARSGDHDQVHAPGAQSEAFGRTVPVHAARRGGRGRGSVSTGGASGVRHRGPHPNLPPRGAWGKGCTAPSPSFAGGRLGWGPRL